MKKKNERDKLFTLIGTLSYLGRLSSGSVPSKAQKKVDRILYNRALKDAKGMMKELKAMK
jgi:hypothetical protein